MLGTERNAGSYPRQKRVAERASRQTPTAVSNQLMTREDLGRAQGNVWLSGCCGRARGEAHGSLKGLTTKCMFLPRRGPVNTRCVSPSVDSVESSSHRRRRRESAQSRVRAASVLFCLSRLILIEDLFLLQTLNKTVIPEGLGVSCDWVRSTCNH